MFYSPSIPQHDQSKSPLLQSYTSILQTRSIAVHCILSPEPQKIEKVIAKDHEIVSSTLQCFLLPQYESIPSVRNRVIFAYVSLSSFCKSSGLFETLWRYSSMALLVLRLYSKFFKGTRGVYLVVSCVK